MMSAHQLLLCVLSFAVVMKYGVSLVFLNPIQCANNNDGSMKCIAAHFDNGDNPMNYSVQFLIPKTIRSLAIHCKSHRNNTFSKSTFAHLERSIQHLTFWNCRFPYIPVDGLCRLTSLRSLEFHSNFRKVIDQRQGKLIDRYGNIIPDLLLMQNFSSKLLCSRSRLQNLSLTGCGIRNIRHTLLDCSISSCCAKLLTLNFSTNFISSIEHGAFDGLQNLKVLDLSGNSISALPPNEISKLKSLTILILTDNPVNRLPTGLFESNPALARLDLGNHHYEITTETDGNRNINYTYFDTKYFVFPKGLTALSMNGVNSTSLSKRFLSSLLNLRQLALVYPKYHEFGNTASMIPSLLKFVLQNVTNLRDLSLQYNGPIYHRMFEKLTNLQTLTLKCRASITDVLNYGLNQLQVLNIESSKFIIQSQELVRQATFSQVFTRIKSLNLKGFSLAFLSRDAFRGLTFLKTIGFGFCALQSVPYGVCNRESASSLTEIYLNNNEIEFLKMVCFQGCTNVIVVDLSHNELISLCETYYCYNQSDPSNTPLSTITKLSRLNLSHNRIWQFDFFMIPQSLLDLDLSYNHLVYIADNNNIRHNLRLKSLNLVQNRLYTFGKNVFPPSLVHLYIGNNEVDTSEAHHTIDISPNHTFHIEADAFSNLRKLQEAVIDQPKDLAISRKSFSSCPSTSGAFFNIEIVHRDFCPPDSPQDRYPLQEQGCDTLSKNVNDFRIISYYNSSRSKHLYCIYKQECGNERYSSHCSLCSKCDKVQSWILNTLDCWGAGFKELSFKFPSELRVNHLHLDGNQLTKVPNNSFVSLQLSLKVLYLNNSHISVIDKYAFAYLKRLRELHLENNEITNAMDFLTPIASAVKILHLQNNRLTNFPFTAHALRWRNATEINLSSNKIAVLDPYLLTGFKSLEKLALRNNSIQSIPMFHGSDSLVNLRHLDLSYNSISSIQPHAFSRVYGLNILELHHNKINRLNGTEFNTIYDLSELSLGNNNIVNISSNTFSELQKLRRLYLNDNALSDLRGRVFAGLSKLQLLNLANNKLEVLNSGTFNSLIFLQELDLSGNSITSLDIRVFSKLGSLKYLYLNNNQIQKIYGLFNALPAMVALRLNHNLLSKLDTSMFEGLQTLEELYLDNNNFRSPQIWKLPKSVTHLTLMNNSLLCDCEFMTDFEEWLSDTGYSRLRDIDTVTCQYSDSGKTTRIQQFDMSDCHQTATFELPLGVTFAVIFVLFVLLCLLYYYRLEIQVSVYARCGKRIFHRDENMDDKHFDAFVAYSSEDEDFVAHQLLPKLPDYRLCFHEKHFKAGAFITDAIYEAIENSSRTVIVFSSHFVQSNWCKFEFRVAHHKALQDRCCRLILIVLGDINEREMDPEQKAYIRTNTYLCWGDKLFWEKLRFALPDVKPIAPVLEGCKSLINTYEIT